MLYSEFIEGTGCRQNDHNYGVYKNLEIMYMNSDMSKDEIYEYGKKLVNNEKSDEMKHFEKMLKDGIKEHKEEIARMKKENEYYSSMKHFLEYPEVYDRIIQNNKREIKWHRQRMKELQWVVG